MHIGTEVSLLIQLVLHAGPEANPYSFGSAFTISSRLHNHVTYDVTMQAPQSVTAAAAAPAGLPQLPARPAAAKAAADAAARRANAASLATSNSTAPSNRSVVNNGPAIKQAAEEIAEAAGLAMADAGVPQTSGQTGKAPLQQSQVLNGSGLANGKPGVTGLSKTSPKNFVPAAASAKDVSVVCFDICVLQKVVILLYFKECNRRCIPLYPSLPSSYVMFMSQLFPVPSLIVSVLVWDRAGVACMPLVVSSLMGAAAAC